jgi:hypothetical protein
MCQGANHIANASIIRIFSTGLFHDSLYVQPLFRISFAAKLLLPKPMLWFHQYRLAMEQSNAYDLIQLNENFVKQDINDMLNIRNGTIFVY